MLTARQQRFVEAYVANPNGAQAAVRAGYSARTARVTASENLRKPEIAAAIDRATKRRRTREDTRLERVRQELAQIAFANIGDILDERGEVRDPSTWPETLRGVTGFSVRRRVTREGDGKSGRVVGRLTVSLRHKLKALEVLGKSLGMFPAPRGRR
jgi:phage terminase small subunit